MRPPGFEPERDRQAVPLNDNEALLSEFEEFFVA